MDNQFTVSWALTEKDSAEVLTSDEMRWNDYPYSVLYLCRLGLLERNVAFEGGVAVVTYSLTNLGQLARQQLRRAKHNAEIDR